MGSAPRQKKLIPVELDQSRHVADAAVDDRTHSGARGHGGAEVVADDRAVLDLAEDVGDHDVALDQRLDDPGVLPISCQISLARAGIDDRLIEIRSVGKEDGGHRTSDDDASRLCLHPAAGELPVVTVRAQYRPRLLSGRGPDSVERRP